MAKVIGIGNQDFGVIRKEGYFYIDKTHFIKEWWENGDQVTLITRPRRFGKTLTMSMAETFFSVRYAGHGCLFEGLSIWESEKYRNLQGTYPVINLSFANIKETNFEGARRKIGQTLCNLYSNYRFLVEEKFLDEGEEKFFKSVAADMDDVTAAMALHQLSIYLSRY